MLIDDLMKTIQVSSQVSEEEVEEDFLMALLRAEKSLLKYRRLVLKRRYGLPSPTMEEEQNCLLPGAVYKRRSLF